MENGTQIVSLLQLDFPLLQTSVSMSVLSNLAYTFMLLASIRFIILKLPQTLAFWVGALVIWIFALSSMVYGILLVLLFWPLGTSDLIFNYGGRLNGFVQEKFLGLSVRVIEGAEHLTPRNAVFVGNHQTELDCCIFPQVFPKYCTITAKRTLKHTPFVGWFLQLSGALFVDVPNVPLNAEPQKAVHLQGPRDTASNLASLKKAGAQLKKSKKKSIFMFPEGRRSFLEEATLLPFKKGAFHFAIQAGLPIIPIVVENYSHILNIKNRRFKPREIRVKVLDPIPTEGLSEQDVGELMNKTHKVMLDKLQTMARPSHASESDSHTNGTTGGPGRRKSITKNAKKMLKEAVGISEPQKVLDNANSTSVDVLSAEIAHALTVAAKNRYISFKDLPDPWRINPYILGGYHFTSSIVHSLALNLRTSNETINVWTHAFGLLFYLYHILIVFPTMDAYLYISTNFLARTLLYSFFASVCLTLFASAIFHTFKSVASLKVFVHCAICDLSAVTFMMATSQASIAYPALACYPHLQRLYISISFLAGGAAIMLPWFHFFRGSPYAWRRAIFYFCLGCLVWIPLVHLIVLEGPTEPMAFYARLKWPAWAYSIGAVIYGAKLPERWRPGWFDFVGASHQIWHVIILIGAFWHTDIVAGMYADMNRRMAACVTY